MAKRERWTAEQRRAQIVEVATGIISRAGYYGFSVHEVAKACDLTLAGLLHHVTSKENLLVMVLEERDRRDAESVVGSAKDVKKPVRLEVAVALVQELVVRNMHQPQIIQLYAVLRAESLHASHPAHEYFNQRDRMALQSFQELFGPHVVDPASFARQALALMGGLEEQWLREPEAVDLASQWDLGIRVLLRGSARPASDKNR